MDKKVLFGLVTVVLIVVLTQQPLHKEASAGLTAERTFSKTTVSPSEIITATYTPATMNYFAIIEPVPAGWSASRTASPDGKIRTTADGSSITIQWTAPASEGTYTFSGEYFVYPDTEYTQFSDDVIIVGSPPDCQCTTWADSSCGELSCSDTQMRQTRTCTPADCDVEGRCVADASCDSNQCSSPAECPQGGECETAVCSSTTGCYLTNIQDGWSCSIGECQDGECVQISCTDTTWNPLPSTVCSGTSFTQTSNCGNTQTATGTKDCTQPCTDSSWTPSPSTKCSGTSFTQTSNCGNTQTATGTKDCSTPSPTDTCEEQLGCELWEECAEDGSGCEIAQIVYIIGGLLLLMMFFSMMK